MDSALLDPELQDLATSPTTDDVGLAANEEEELEAAFEDRQPEGGDGYDSDASDQRFEQRLQEEMEDDDSDVSEYRIPVPQHSAKAGTRGKPGSKSAGNTRYEYQEDESEGDSGSDAHSNVDDDMNGLEEGEADETNEAGRSSNFFQMVNNIAQTSDMSQPTSANRRVAARDQVLLDPLSSIREDLRAARGFKSKGGRGRRGGRTKKLAPELQDLSSEAFVAFVNGDMDLAFDLASELIRRDAEIPQAWSCLAGVHEARGDRQKELGCRLIHAQLSRDPAIWSQVKDIAEQLNNPEVAKYAQKRALSTDPMNPETLFETAMYHAHRQEDRFALKCVRRLFAIRPYDIDYLKSCIFLFGSGSPDVDIWEGIQFLTTAFDYHINTFSTPFADPTGDVDNNMDRDYVVLLVDLLILARDYDYAATVIKRAERWLQSRSSQKFWNKLDNDCEYDPVGAVRTDSETITEDQEGYELDISLRARLAVIRLKLGHDEDADIHIKVVKESSAFIHAPLWIDIAKALMDRAKYSEATTMLQKVYEDIPTPTPPHPLADQEDVQEYEKQRAYLNECLINLGVCNQRLRNYETAIEIFQSVLSDHPDDLETKSQLALVYEDRGEKGDLKLALQLVREVRQAKQTSASGQHDANATAQDEGAFFNAEQVSYSTLRARARQNKNEANAQLELHTKTLVERLQQVEAAAFQGDEVAVQTYISDARQMVTELRQAHILFPKEKGVKFHIRSKVKRLDVNQFHAATVADERRLEDKIQDEDADTTSASDSQLVQKLRTRFLGLSADTWMDITVKFASLLLRADKPVEVAQMAQHMAETDIFQPEKHKVRLKLLVLSAAMRIGDLDIVLDTVRFFTQYYQYRIEPWQLIAALGSSHRATHRFTNTVWQKYMIRQLKLWNVAAGGASLFWHDPLGRWVHPKTDKQTAGLSARPAPRHRTKTATGSRNRDEAHKEQDGHQADRPTGQTAAGDSSDSGESDQEEEEVHGEDVHMTKQAMRAALFPGFRPDPPQIPKKRAIVLEMIYGQTLAAAKSWQGAIAYYLRAYAINPYDSLLCLCLAHAYLARSLQRQCDNKLHTVTLGLTFLNRYRALRQKDAEEDASLLEEIDFNFGRAFHGIGVANLAAKHYRMCLVSIEKRMNESMEPEVIRRRSNAGEAAYNLMTIFLLSGSPLLAKNVSDKWLAV